MTIVKIQYDIFGNVVPQKLCKCGCGEPVYGKNDYIHGHYMSGEFGREEQSKRLTQYYINNPEAGKENSERQIQYYKAHPEVKEEASKRTKQYFIDHPEARDETGGRLQQYYINNPEAGKENSERQIQYYKAHPEVKEEASKRTKQYFIDHPEARDDASKRQIQYFIDHPETCEKISATLQNQDYNKGEWTGFTDKLRSYIIPVNNCIQLNKNFDNSNAHHITPSIIIFIPKELHRHIYHNLKTGQGMAEMNMLALQFINGCYDYVKL